MWDNRRDIHPVNRVRRITFRSWRSSGDLESRSWRGIWVDPGIDVSMTSAEGQEGEGRGARREPYQVSEGDREVRNLNVSHVAWRRVE